MQPSAPNLAQLFCPPWWLATPQRRLLAIAFFAALLSASGFILEYGFGVLPCPMCWWQRYCHYGILAAAVATLWASPRHPVRIPLAAIATLAATGLFVAIWQFSAQHNWLPFPATCTSENVNYSNAVDLLSAMQNTKVIPCDKETFTLLGLSLAGWNIPSMLAIIFLANPFKK